MFKKTVLLTGATGFIGSHLLQGLLEKSYKIVILKRSASDTWRIDQWLESCDCYNIDQQEIKEAFNNHKIDAVVHLATQYGRKNQEPMELIQANLLFGVELLSESIKHDVPLFINTDSFYSENKKLLGELDHYNLSKRQFVEWLRQYKEQLETINMKLHHVYGERDSSEKFVPWLTSEILKSNQNIELTHGEQLRDFVYVRDVVSAYIQLIESPRGAAGFHEHLVCTGKKTSLKNFCSTLNEEIKKVTGHNGGLSFGAKKPRPNELMDVINDNESLRSAGWTPQFNLESGIREMLKSELRA